MCIRDSPNQVVRRFFALDTQTYQAGALDVKTKELLGLVASMVLRCDDCISYHVAPVSYTHLDVYKRQAFTDALVFADGRIGGVGAQYTQAFARPVELSGAALGLCVDRILQGAGQQWVQPVS